MNTRDDQVMNDCIEPRDLELSHPDAREPKALKRLFAPDCSGNDTHRRYPSALS